MQSATSHAHHPIPTYVATVLWLLATISFVGTIAFDWDARDNAIGWLIGAVAVLIAMSRTYVTSLQDRIILLEMKIRCAEKLPAGEDARLAQLTTPQVVALRFASDAELGPLLDRAVRERMTPDDIKKAIRDWRPDNLRT